MPAVILPDGSRLEPPLALGSASHRSISIILLGASLALSRILRFKGLVVVAELESLLFKSPELKYLESVGQT